MAFHLRGYIWIELSETTETLETYTHMFKKNMEKFSKYFDSIEEKFNVTSK